LIETTGLPLPGVRDLGDLTAFQRMALIAAGERRAEMEQEEVERAKNEAPSHSRPNRGALPGGGITKSDASFREVKRYTNLSEKTGKSPEQLIKEYQESNGDSRRDS
jgi:hypothetical protein